MRFVTGPEYLKLPRSPDTWIVEDLLPISGLCNIYGKPKAGKSWAALGLALAVANGEDSWLNFPIHAHGPVAYVQIDTPRSLWADEYLVPLVAAGADLSNIYFVDSEIVPYPFNVLGEGGPALADALAALSPRPTLVILDTLRDSHALNENDSGANRNVVTALVAASRPSALVLISHSRKDYIDSSDDIIEGARGSSYIAGRMDGIARISAKDREGTAGEMQFQSRTAAGSVSLVRDRVTGLWLPRVPWEAVVRDVQAHMPGATQNALGEAIGQRLGCSRRQGIRYLKRFTEVASAVPR